MNAPVTVCMVALCFLATLLGQISGGVLTENFFMTYHSPLANPMTWVRFFSHVWGHSGWEHFSGNAAYLLLLGPMLEEKYGSHRVVELILSTAGITGLIHYILFPKAALCGASGVVFAFILLTSFAGAKKDEIPVTFLLVFVVFVGQQVVQGIFAQGNVSYLSHILGGIVGSFFGYKLCKEKKV